MSAVEEGVIYVTHVAPYTTGPAGVHGVLGQSVVALGQLAEAAGLGFLHVDDVRRLPVDQLSSAAVVALFTIGETPWDASQRAALLSGVRSGGTGLLAIHASTDACYGWDDYGHLVGARFNGHPWTQDIQLEVCEPDHPALAHLGSTWPWRDEVYQFRDLRPDARVLLRVAEEDLDLNAKGATRPAHGFPLAWCFTEGLGRVLYTALGHFPGAWENPLYLRHLAGGLAWVRGAGD